MTDKSNKSSKAGFTLIEVIIVGVLMSALVLGAFPVFMMYKDTTRETKMNLKMQRQAEALVDEIARRVRAAMFVIQNAAEEFMLPEGDCEGGVETSLNCEFRVTEETVYDEDPDDITRVKQIIIHDVANNETSVFQFRQDAAGVATVLLNGTPFMVGGREVLVDYARSNFELRGDRRQVRINMVLRAVASNGREFTLSIQRGTFRCRN
jgi:type II secretory pathway pseudopilin PulG